MTKSTTGFEQQWAIVSGAATAAGAVLAILVFPEAGFARNPTGMFGWHLVGFASLVGGSLAIGQWFVLRRIPAVRTAGRPVVTALWIPLTTIGIIATVLPLWSVDAMVLTIVPLAVVVPVMPGIVFLGAAQWSILYLLTGANSNWILATIAGATLGTIVGLVTAVVLPLPVEPIWAGVTGLGLGVLQGMQLPQKAL